MEDLEILSSALKIEKTGEEFYRKIAASCTENETRRAYETLAEDETHHAVFIQRQLDALTGGGDWQVIAELEDTPPLDIDTPIFEVNVELLKTIPEEASEEDALLFALGVEVTTYELYMNAARLTAEGPGREMFLKLANAERGHFDLLMTRYEAQFGYPR
jgi:rubrerythrin